MNISDTNRSMSLNQSVYHQLLEQISTHRTLNVVSSVGPIKSYQTLPGKTGKCSLGTYRTAPKTKQTRKIRFVPFDLRPRYWCFTVHPR